MDPFTPWRLPTLQNRRKSSIPICKILRNRQQHIKVLLKSFHFHANGTLNDFIHWLKSWNHLAQQYKRCHKEVLFNSFHLNDNTFKMISSTDSKVRTTFENVINSTTGKYSVDFIWMITLKDFIHRLKSKNNLIKRNKQHHRKVLLSSFHVNGHTLEFHSQTQMFESPRTAYYTPMEYVACRATIRITGGCYLFRAGHKHCMFLAQFADLYRSKDNVFLFKYSATSHFSF